MKRLIFAAMLLAGVSACGGGGGGGAPAVPVPQASSSSQPAPQATADVATVNPAGFAAQIPTAGGYAGTVGFGAAPGATGTVTISAQTASPTGLPQVASVKRVRDSLTNTGVVYVTVEFSAKTTMNTLPSFVFGTPASANLSSGRYLIAMYDPTNTALGWQLGVLGPATISGSQLTIAANNTPVTFAASQPYVFALYNANGTLTDDWTTYAHDSALTGFQQMPTGIDASSVSRLQLAWSFQPNQPCEQLAINNQVIADQASPLVAGGYVYYADACGYVAALDRNTGNLVWHYQAKLPDAATLEGAYGTPTLDTAKNLLIVPIEGAPGAGCHQNTQCATPAHGGFLVALDAKQGTFVWQTPPLTAGNMRGEPIAVNGKVFEGLAGGDFFSGYVNGGILAFDETTGQPISGLSQFFVAPPTSTNDGGASWSPISTDGVHLYFGTGNTRYADGYQNSVVQLNPGNMQATQYIVPTYNAVGDGDVGGGEMLWQGNMYFSGKSGNFYGYRLGGTPPIPLFNPVQINKNPSGGAVGGIGTPTTDGNVIAVSSGYNVGGSGGIAPYQSDLDVFPVGSSTESCKLSAAGSAIYSYAAFVSGLGFIGIDNGLPGASAASAFVAFDDHCNIVWKANPTDLHGFFYGGPAVVQSGVYAIDNTGMVYAWKLPQMIGASARTRQNAARATPVLLRMTNYAHRLSGN